MKTLLIAFVCIIFFSSAFAQNYQCLQAGVKHYFTNGNGYLRGIRIDSVRTMGDSTVYYPFHTPRGEYSGFPVSFADTNGGSWVGKKVLQTNDGTFIFDSYWNGSVIIRTLANVGDSWTFYRDTGSLYYEATMLVYDTMTILGVFDSVKIIQITAQDTSGIVTTDPVDSFQIILSKNNGFVQVFDLYTFPYHKPDSAYRTGLDFYLDLSTSAFDTNFAITSSPPSKPVSLFSLVNFINPNARQLRNWHEGDVIASYYGDGFPYMLDNVYVTDSITSETETGTTTNYYMIGDTFTCHSIYPFPCLYINDAGSMYFDSLIYPIEDSGYIPEQSFNRSNSLYYFPNDTGFCMTSPKYEILPFAPPSLDFEYYYSIYKYGIGLTDYEYIDEDGDSESIKLAYYKINGKSCGLRPTEKVSNIVPKMQLILLPNPATNELTIKNSLTQNYTIALTNMLGHTIVNLASNKPEETINVSTLPAGVYNVSITDENGDRVNNKVVIER